MLAAVALALLAGCGAPQGGGTAVPNVPSVLDPASPNARAIADFTWAIHLMMAAVFLGVFTALVLFAFRYRARPGHEQARQIHGNATLEVAWTATPAVILTVFFVMSLNVMCNVDPVIGAAEPAVPDSLRVVATGRQWWWEYAMPELGVLTANELRLPAGRTARLELHSGDVMHNWWVPALHGKLYMMPGRVNVLTFTPTEEGIYGGVCGEFCGVQHAWMRLRVVVDAPAAFDAWAAAQAAPAAGPVSAQAQRGQQVFVQATCSSCHAINGQVQGPTGPAPAPPRAAQGTVYAGPNLTHLASRATLAAGVLENTPENLAAWLRDPQQVKPGNLMPAIRLTEDEVQALVAYLLERP